MKLIPCISSTNSLEQIEFYRDALNATLVDHKPATEEMIERIVTNQLPLEKTTMHAQIQVFGQDIYLSDARIDTKFGNNITLAICFEQDQLEEANTAFNKLADSGFVLVQLEKQFWGASFGMVVDKFNISWQVHINN